MIEKEFAHLEPTTFLNSAYFGPSPLRAKAKVEQALSKELNPSFYAYHDWTRIPDQTRTLFAGLLGASPDSIAHATSVTDVMGMLAHGLDFDDQDVICCLEGDYPSNVLPWMCTGINAKVERLHQLNITADWAKKHLPKNTKVLAVTHITFDTGRRVDLIELGKLCHERDIFFFVDTTQAFGGMPITSEELQHIDVLACSSYKWMLGPYGHAFAYFSDRMIKQCRPQSGNWLSSTESSDVTALTRYTTQTLPGARKFDRGQAPSPLINACLSGAMEFLAEVGLETIAKHNSELRDYFLDIYPKDKFSVVTPDGSRGNILCLSNPTMCPKDLKKKLHEESIDISIREGNIRVSFHIFNTRSQVEHLTKALDSI